MTTEQGRPVMERIEPPLTGDERDTLRAFLDYHRATLAMKCAGLGDEELRRRSVSSSTLTLLGLVRHLAEVERFWFRRVIGGEDVGRIWTETEDFQVAFDIRGAGGPEAFAAWQEEIGHARRIEREAPSLDVTGHMPKWASDVSLRLVMHHLVHEYARHNGHADLLRESIDGAVGA